MSRVVPAFQIGQNVYRRRPQIWTAFHVNGRRSRWESSCCDSSKSSPNCPWSCRRSRNQVRASWFWQTNWRYVVLPQNLCRVCWQMHKKWSVSQSVRSFLVVRMLMKTFWKISKQVMKLGCTATMLKQKNSRRSGWKHFRHERKKHVRVAQMWR